MNNVYFKYNYTFTQKKKCETSNLITKTTFSVVSIHKNCKNI